MTKTKAQRIWNHLLKTNQYWCFDGETGAIIFREYVESILKK